MIEVPQYNHNAISCTHPDGLAASFLSTKPQCYYTKDTHFVPGLCGHAVLLQRGTKKERVFIAITSALTWARTNSPSHSTTADPSTLPHADSTQPDANTALDQSASSLPEHSLSTDAAGMADFEGEALEPQPPADLTSADADRRMATATARAVLEAELTILAANTRHFKTYVVCPGLLYGKCIGLACELTGQPVVPRLSACGLHLQTHQSHTASDCHKLDSQDTKANLSII